MDEKKATELVPVSETRAELPPILAGRHTAAVEAQVRSFYLSVARHLRTLGHSALEHAHAAGLPPGRDGLRPLPRHPLARRIDPALHGLGRGRARVSRSDARRVQGPQDHQPPDRVAVLVLQIPPGRRLRVPAAHHGPQSGTRPVHPPGLVRPARRDQGPLGDPCPAAHGAPLRRHGVRLPGPGHHQVLPL